MKLADLPVHAIPGLSGPNAPIDKEIAATARTSRRRTTPTPT